MFTQTTTRNNIPNKQVTKKMRKPASPPDLKPEGIKSAAYRQLPSNITAKDSMYRKLHRPLHAKPVISKTTFQTSLKGEKTPTIATNLPHTDPDSATENKWRAQALVALLASTTPDTKVSAMPSEWPES